MEFKRIVLIGTYAKNKLHEMYDTGLLHVCSLVAERVDCYKDKTTFPFIMEKNKEFGFLENVKLHKIYNYSPESVYKRIFGFILSSLTDIYIYIKSPKDCLIVYAYTNVFTIHLLNLLNHVLRKNVVFSTHGEMELLINNKKGVLTNLFRSIFHHFFTKCKADKRICFITLGDSLYKNLKNVVSDYNYKRFIVIDHPCYISERLSRQRDPSKNRLGVLASPTKGRGLDETKSFVEKMSKSKINYTLSIVGRVPVEEQQFFDSYNVDYLIGLVPREEYERKVKECDYVLSFYPADSYKLIASGVLLDALGLNKPILTLRNDYSEYVLNKTNYPSAIFDKVEEMVDFITADKAKGLYNLNFNGPKNIFTPSAVSKTFASEINRLYDNVID